MRAREPFLDESARPLDVPKTEVRLAEQREAQAVPVDRGAVLLPDRQ